MRWLTISSNGNSSRRSNGSSSSSSKGLEMRHVLSCWYVFFFSSSQSARSFLFIKFLKTLLATSDSTVDTLTHSHHNQHHFNASHHQNDSDKGSRRNRNGNYNELWYVFISTFYLLYWQLFTYRWRYMWNRNGNHNKKSTCMVMHHHHRIWPIATSNTPCHHHSISKQQCDNDGILSTRFICFSFYTFY